ncbi:RHS repeat-associated core domain-containing protein [Pseudomonas sp. CCOS 191]|uniref:RHS repeat-associated core domain-containing protein n=1 Tax=Pseudomonas sp. CCOS 191 TaxID=1649877 RepID=UPI001E3BBFC5|nr:RHS repeat-associated core domain-containing protein [Pseudomonas sp. CCOS 191]
MSLYLPMLDHQRSPFSGSTYFRAYTPYGAAAVAGGPVLGFCGQLRERPMGIYQLGSGYRCYSPNVLRFLSPDQLSPFGEGGLNVYSYCAGDPVNKWDLSGGVWEPIFGGTMGIIGTVETATSLAANIKLRMDIKAQKAISNDPAVLNTVEPTRTRILQEKIATGLAAGAAASAGATLAGVPMAAPVGVVLAGGSFGAWALDKVAARRETKRRENPLDFLRRSAGTRENRIVAAFKVVQRSINDDLERAQTARRALWEPIHQEMRNMVVMAPDYDVLLDAVNETRKKD